MNKITSAIILLAFYTGAYSQNSDSTAKKKINDSEIICKIVDEFTDEISYSTEGAIAYEDGGDMKSEGMLLRLFLTKKNNMLKAGTLYVKVVGLKGCVDEGSSLIVIFENGEKTKLINWKKFNCKGKNYFTLTKQNIELFKNSEIKGLKYTNKRDFESMIVKENINSENKSFIKDVLTEIDEINKGDVKVGTCD